MDNNDDSKKRKSIKKVVWDEEKLAECEHEKHLIPKTKIDEAKTPYVHPIEDSSDPYVLMLKEYTTLDKYHPKPAIHTCKSDSYPPDDGQSYRQRDQIHHNRWLHSCGHLHAGTSDHIKS